MHKFPGQAACTRPIALLSVLLLLMVSISALADGHGEKASSVSPDDPSLEWMDCPDFLAKGCGIAILSIDEDGRNAAVFFRYPAGETFVEHWHNSAERILMVRGAMEVTYEGQDPATVSVGDYAFGPAQRKHHGTCISEEDCLLFIAFAEPPDTFEVVSTD